MGSLWSGATALNFQTEVKVGDQLAYRVRSQLNGTWTSYSYQLWKITNISDVSTVAGGVTVVYADVYQVDQATYDANPSSLTNASYKVSSNTAVATLDSSNSNQFIKPKGYKIGDHANEIKSSTETSLGNLASSVTVEKISKDYGIRLVAKNSSDTTILQSEIIYASTGILLKMNIMQNYNGFISNVEYEIIPSLSTAKGADQDPNNPGQIAGFPVEMLAVLISFSILGLIKKRHNSQ
jgi:hypothetical protein